MKQRVLHVNNDVCQWHLPHLNNPSNRHLFLSYFPFPSPFSFTPCILDTWFRLPPPLLLSSLANSVVATLLSLTWDVRPRPPILCALSLAVLRFVPVSRDSDREFRDFPARVARLPNGLCPCDSCPELAICPGPILMFTGLVPSFWGAFYYAGTSCKVHGGGAPET